MSVFNCCGCTINQEYRQKGNNSDFVSDRFYWFAIFSRDCICGGYCRLWAQGKVGMMSKRSSLICKVHLKYSGYSGGTLKFTYTLLCSWKTILSMSFRCLNHSIYILNTFIFSSQLSSQFAVLSCYCAVPVLGIEYPIAF